MQAVDREAALACSENRSHVRHPGRNASVQMYMRKVANASFNQKPSHHSMVTRFPNHWCATLRDDRGDPLEVALDAVYASTRRSVSRKMMHPTFSIAP